MFYFAVVPTMIERVYSVGSRDARYAGCEVALLGQEHGTHPIGHADLIPYVMYTDIATGLTTLDMLKQRVAAFAHVVAANR